MEQLVARRAHNPKVVGSSPAPATLKLKSLKLKDLGLFVLLVKSDDLMSRLTSLPFHLNIGCQICQWL
jgi:hypothetical protein